MSIQYSRESIEQVKNAVSILDIAENLGLEPTNKGSNIVCYCPNPNHDDHHKTNCFLYESDNSGYCFGCGFHFDIISLLKLQGYSFTKAIEYLSGLSGMKLEGKKVKPSPLFLTRKEKELIGLTVKNSVKCPIGFADVGDSNTMYDRGGNKLKYKMETNLWDSMLSDEGKKYIIINRCKDKLMRLADIERQLLEKKVNCISEEEAKPFQIMYDEIHKMKEQVIKIGNRIANA